MIDGEAEVQALQVDLFLYKQFYILSVFWTADHLCIKKKKKASSNISLSHWREKKKKGKVSLRILVFLSKVIAGLFFPGSFFTFTAEVHEIHDLLYDLQLLLEQL